MNGAAARQMRAYSSRKPGATTSLSLSRVEPKKSFRFKSSASGCSGSAQGGTRFSESPPSSSRFEKAPVRVACRQRPGSATIASRIAVAASVAGCQIPAPAKTSPGPMCR